VKNPTLLPETPKKTKWGGEGEKKGEDRQRKSMILVIADNSSHGGKGDF